MAAHTGIRLDLEVTIRAGVHGAGMHKVGTATLDALIPTTLTPTSEGATLTLTPDAIQTVITTGMEAFATAVGHQP